LVTKMFVPSSQMIGTGIRGTDENVGSIADLLFDTDTWVVRHVVVDTGKWLPGRQVLIPPTTLETRDWPAGSAGVRLSRQQVKESPPLEDDRPVSRQLETELYQYYSVPYYWGPTGAPLAAGDYTPVPFGLNPALPKEPQEAPQSVAHSESNHLRSVSEVTGYYIRAADDDIGHVEEFLIDDSDWALRYFVIDTRNWLPGRKVLVARDWVDAFSWSDSTVSVGLTKEQIKQSPEFDLTQSIDRAYEERLHGHYGRGGYWMM